MVQMEEILRLLAALITLLQLVGEAERHIHTPPNPVDVVEEVRLVVG
jgi:hypothetical protein